MDKPETFTFKPLIAGFRNEPELSAFDDDEIADEFARLNARHEELMRTNPDYAEVYSSLPDYGDWQSGVPANEKVVDVLMRIFRGWLKEEERLKRYDQHSRRACARQAAARKKAKEEQLRLEQEELKRQAAMPKPVEQPKVRVVSEKMLARKKATALRRAAKRRAATLEKSRKRKAREAEREAKRQEKLEWDELFKSLKK